jgi:hypothetical protein
LEMLHVGGEWVGRASTCIGSCFVLGEA